ncbi:hypothetical protein J2D73_11145 [Acetobacter sacchari]|uniref:Uncharacterized protein n=1 Tax=Acetobacter sacchari TaxID=2661687 RepID=A0ABS3LWP2_9PROT|nr:YidB family protein [Acetobacter sacchari]MBO1360343.1 hypothetical protein [Acetobacter sacchari]
MSGFLKGLKDKALNSVTNNDAVAEAVRKMLASEHGKAGVEHIVQQCEKVGLGEKARCWANGQPAEPLTVEEVQRLLTSDQAKFIASCTGLPLAPLLPLIAKTLPVAVERMAARARAEDAAAPAADAAEA